MQFQSSMTKVSIVGAAGTVGAAAGYNLALRDVADELVFVDIPSKEDETVGQAADANHGAAYDSNTTVSQGDYSATEGSDVVVITAGIPRQPGQTRIDLAGDNAPIMEDIQSSLDEYNDDYISLTTSNPVDLLNRHLYEAGDRDRHQVIGFGGRLDSARFRYVLSERFDRAERRPSSSSTATPRYPCSRRSASTVRTPSSPRTRRRRSSAISRRAR